MSRYIKLLSLALTLVVVFSSVFTACTKKTDSEETTASTTTTISTTTSTTETTETTQITTTVTTTEAVTEPVVDEKLMQMIKDAIPTDNGDWAVYYKNLKDNKVVSINNKKMVSASLIKLFIMGMVYDEIDAGKLEQTSEIDSLMEKMITISHNDSSNRLVEIAGGNNFQAGMAMVNRFATTIGCPDTEQQRNMLDSRPVPIPEQNYTSVEDCGTILERIYNKELINDEFDEHMLDLLLHQQRTWKIPAGLPAGTKVANKTGELSTTENDVAIIFTDKADYILCVISNDLSSTGSAQKTISKIAGITYDYVMSNY